MNPDYPRLAALGVPIINGCVNFTALDIEMIAKKGEQYQRTFNDLFGVQTCRIIDGEPCGYADDVEAVLERMESGKLTGSQLFWD